jgi:hypothetical protein
MDVDNPHAAGEQLLDLPYVSVGIRAHHPGCIDLRQRDLRFGFLLATAPPPEATASSAVVDFNSSRRPSFVSRGPGSFSSLMRAILDTQ